MIVGKINDPSNIRNGWYETLLSWYLDELLSRLPMTCLKKRSKLN
jgi:hypothetical protein